jgi:hypothetical protein
MLCGNDGGEATGTVLLRFIKGGCYEILQGGTRLQARKKPERD